MANNNNNNKMKGLLKGLRYISHMFENEKELDMQIGFPTDVKHVAHIGWDGPSVNSPSWMNDFKSPPGFSSAPLTVGGEIKDDSSIKWVSEDSNRSARSSPRRDPELPKASRRHASTGSSAESPTAREKPKQTRKSSKHSNKDLTDTSKSKELSPGGESPPRRPDIPKKSRTKKSKDSIEGSSRSSRSSRRAHGSKSDTVSESDFVSKANNISELSQTSAFNSSKGGEEREEKEFTGVS